MQEEEMKNEDIYTRQDKSEYLEANCNEIQNAVDRQNMKKELTGEWILRTDVDVKAPTEEGDIKERWAKYGKTLYGKRDYQHDVAFQNGSEREPTRLRSEVVWALGQVKNGKSPGIDDIPIEILKTTGENGIELLWRFCTRICEAENGRETGAEPFSFPSQRREN